MAGEWIKLEKCTFDKPEVIAMADALEISEAQVVGCLAWVWSWFDSQTTNGNAPSVTVAFVNRKVGVAGFGEAMLSTGWLTENSAKDGGLTMPNFDRHNSKSAKKRALTAQRQQRYRNNAAVTPVASPEKRREENIYPPTPLRGGAVDKNPQNSKATPNPTKPATRQPDPRKQIAAARHPNQLANLCRHYGWGDPPAGMDMESAKAWAAKKVEVKS